MTELPTPDATKVAVARIIDKHVTAMLEDLDDLHENGISDDDILATLRKNGYGQEADLYHEWLQDSVPRRYVAEDGDPEGPGGHVTDPSTSDSYVRFEELMNEARSARSITYDWTERERMIYSCRATVDREHYQKWLALRGTKTVEEADGEDLVDYLEANPWASSDERRWPADESEVDVFDLKVVESRE